MGSFGSQANATALPGSDIDITILGVHDMDGASGIKRCAAWASPQGCPSLCWSQVLCFSSCGSQAWRMLTVLCQQTALLALLEDQHELHSGGIYKPFICQPHANNLLSMFASVNQYLLKLHHCAAGTSGTL